MRKPKAVTPWLRPFFDSGEILGMIWTPLREPREADEGQDPQQRGTTLSAERGTEGAKQREIQAKAWGQRAGMMRKGGVPAFVNSGGMAPFGLLPPSSASVRHLQPRTAPTVQPGSAG